MGSFSLSLREAIATRQSIRLTPLNVYQQVFILPRRQAPKRLKKLYMTLHGFVFQINNLWIAALPMVARNDGDDL